MPNRLATSLSPYLRQHADNPVDWFEWGEEAFAKAKSEDKPIFLSVGYSSCHWCHVMAHESFEDPEVGAFLNEYFVSIKLDREERPDLDEAYMMATQLISKRGGWPMTVLMTPDKKPFFAGTYFPKNDRPPYPGLMSVLKQIAAMWQSKRRDVEQSAAEIARAIEASLSRSMSSVTSKIEPELFKQCFQAQRSSFDAEYGGFGEAPKFPAHSALTFLLDYAAVDPQSAPDSVGMVFGTLSAMARGGIHDHVGGGFHRYSTDREWLLPHFEKMLCDNALMLVNFARAGRLADEVGAPEGENYVKAALGIVEWVRREMTAENGMFFSAQDADSEAEEGRSYVWSKAEIEAILGSSADAFCHSYGVREEGNFLDEATQTPTGKNVLYLLEGTGREFVGDLVKLKAVRDGRPQPFTDQKCIAAWNGMMIAALSEIDEIGLAERCAHAWVAAINENRTLPHMVMEGVASGTAFLDDFAWMIQGFATLAGATGNTAYTQIAGQLADEMLRSFEDAEKGGFYYIAEGAEAVLGRSKPVLDQALPSPNAAAVHSLLHLGRQEQAERALMAVVGWAQKAPSAAESLIHAAMLLSLSSAQGQGEVSSLIPDAQPAAAAGPKPKVTAKLSAREIRADSDGWAKLAVQITVPEELHLNTNEPPARWLTPTQVAVQPLQAVVEYPAGSEDRYEGDFQIPVKLKSTGKNEEFELRLSFQACTDAECMAPDEIVLDGVVLV